MTPLAENSLLPMSKQARVLLDMLQKSSESSELLALETLSPGPYDQQRSREGTGRADLARGASERSRDTLETDSRV